ncbi:MAG: translocation/assembly module TamB domain-containing protein [Acidobacteriota bacterium]
MLSGERKIDLTIEDPLIEINEGFPSSSDSRIKTNSKFSINKVNIKNGELRYVSEKLSIILLDFNVLSYSKGDDISFRVNSPHMKVNFIYSNHEVKLEGDLESEFTNKSKVFKISKFRWGTEDLVITGNGNISRNGNIALHVFTDGEMDKILYPVLKDLTLNGDIRGNATIVKDTKGRVVINCKFNSPEVKIQDESFYDFRGTVKWNNRTKKIRVNTTTFSEGLLNTMNIDSQESFAKIDFANVSTAKMAKTIQIYTDIPMGGVIRKGTLELNGKHLTGNISVEKDVKTDAEFNVHGDFDIEYHISEKWVKFKTTDSYSEFGHMRDMSGYIDNKQKIIKLDMDSDISELSGAHKYLMHYVDLDLSQWGVQKGNGRASLNVNRQGKRTEIYCKLDVKDMLSNEAPIKKFSAVITGLNNSVDVNFRFDDRELKGKAHLRNRPGKLEIDFYEVVGDTSKIFKILEYNIDLKGMINGSFSYLLTDEMKEPLIRGKYTGRSLNFYDFIFRDVSGELEVTDQIKLEELAFEFRGGSGKTDIAINYDTEYFKIDGAIRSIDINRINNGFYGKGDLEFNGEGSFNKDPLKLKYNFPEVTFYSGRPFAVKGEGAVFTDFEDYMINAPGVLINRGIESPFKFSFGFSENIYHGALDINFRDINAVMPWENNKGVMNLRSEINSDINGYIHMQGVADFNGDFISFPGFPHTLNNFRGSLFFRDLDFTMRSFSGTMGGGRVTGNGKLKVEENELKDLLVTFNGRNMFIFPMERSNAMMNANLSLQKRKNKYILGGTINFDSLLWERELDEGISFYAGNSEASEAPSKFLDNLEFDISMKGKDNIKINNSFVRGDGEIDLRLTGNKDFPVLSGSVRGSEGAVLISGREFNLVKAKLIFNNNVRINPLVRLEAETFIKNYRIKFIISGLSSSFRPEFVSSPPLPQQDIIALISLGELFRRSSSTNISSEVGTTGLVTTALTDQIQKRVKKLFGIDMLKLDPDPTRSSLEGVSRLTIGKSISKDFLIVYSTDISRATRDVYFFQYQITPTISLIGKRNEEGRLSLDIRFRKRY